jgi:hypothetical protein
LRHAAAQARQRDAMRVPVGRMLQAVARHPAASRRAAARMIVPMQMPMRARLPALRLKPDCT